MKFKKLILLIATALALTSCGLRFGGNSKDNPPSSAPIEYSAVNENIGPSGGQVKDQDNKLTLTIPAGALNSDTNISAQYIADSVLLDNQKPMTGFLGAATFGPSGTVFNKPIEVSIDLTDSPIENGLSVFCYDEKNDVWDYVTSATLVGNKAYFEITHFSTYQIANRSADFYNVFQNIVHHAITNGLSDAEIIDSFKDYLINTKHVMDYYEKFDGYWYEPCGLYVSGAYEINGQQGDPNALIAREGTSNKVGNTYGLSKIDGATSSQEEYKNKTASSEKTSCLVIVEYKIINPDISLSASKKKLNKGESATISIYCHYVNPTNSIPAYQDLELAGYFLTITKPIHFSVDRYSVTTNGEGRASFVVTANEKDKAETITVNFDVSGDFGTHAEGNITLNSGGGYSISGSVEQIIEVTYYPPGIGGFVTSIGSFTLTVSYDLEGNLSVDENTVSGSISFMNATATISDTPCWARDDESSCKYNFFKSITSITPFNPSFEFIGSVSNDVCSITNTSTKKDIVTISGSGDTTVYEGGGSGVVDVNGFEFKFSSSSNLLLGFAIEEDVENIYTSSNLKDSLSSTIIYGSAGSFPLDNAELSCTYSYYTTQTITIALADNNEQ